MLSMALGGPGLSWAQGPQPKPGTERLLDARAVDPVQADHTWGVREFDDTFGGSCLETGLVDGDRFGNVDDQGQFVDEPPGHTGAGCSTQLSRGMESSGSAYYGPMPSACMTRESACDPTRERTVVLGIARAGMTGEYLVTKAGRADLPIAADRSFLAVLHGWFGPYDRLELWQTYHECDPNKQRRYDGQMRKVHGCDVSIEIFPPPYRHEDRA